MPVISVLIRMRFLPPWGGGDPFSHPSGSSVSRRARVRTRLPCANLRPRTAHALLPESGSQKTFSAQPRSFSGDKGWLAPLGCVRAARPNFRRLKAGSNHYKFSRPLRSGGYVLQGDGSGRATKSPVACGRCPAPLTKFMVIAAKRRGRSSRFHVQGQKFPVHGRKCHVTSAKSVVRDSPLRVRGSKFHARGKV